MYQNELKKSLVPRGEKKIGNQTLLLCHIYFGTYDYIHTNKRSTLSKSFMLLFLKMSTFSWRFTTHNCCVTFKVVLKHLMGLPT